MERINAPFECKTIDSVPGGFEGYVSVYGNKDLGGDVILPGAFDDVKTTKDGKLRIALYHDLTKLAAKVDWSQDGHGMHVKGALLMGLSYASDAYLLMKDGILDGMSVGFEIAKGGSKFEKDPGGNGSIRVIQKATLWEGSIVPFGMNPLASLTNVKDISSLSEIEGYLRDACGLSRSEAKTLISKIKGADLPRDAGDEDNAAIVAALNRNLQILRG
jgi:HK97 family phage prohead protease